MAREYSTYEAKARFSEIIRAVMGGQRVVIRFRGRPVAEVRPLEAPEIGLADRIGDLERSGVLGPAPRAPGRLAPIARREGALQRFLGERE
ncbi:type II toxin-antitoxin system prevent-host-death family antitoxin [Myxococcota bacterium]|nr:type II toxin-antitoxin system prevent-host-death family antitoxin [Myxococcota bacterium]